MAKTTTVTLTDDLDGSPADETVTFSLDGQSYEIDLSKNHAAQLRNALDKYVAAGRKVSRSGRSTRKATRSDIANIRAWAKENNIKDENGNPVGDRGRIPQSIQEQYDNAAGGFTR